MRRPRRTSTPLAALLALGLALGVWVADATPAGAQAVDHCGSDGTEWVPDRGSGFDFGHACLRHDLCYGLKPHGDGSDGRLACDREFLQEMRMACAVQAGPYLGPTPCASLADLYYGAVRLFGGTPFEQAETPTGTVTIGGLEPIRDDEPSGGGGGGGHVGGGGVVVVGGGGGGTPTGTVTVGDPEPVEQDAE